jgi:putative ABC transport system permease protein
MDGCCERRCGGWPSAELLRHAVHRRRRARLRPGGGTAVLGRTVDQAFDRLFAERNAGVDVLVRAAPAFAGQTGGFVSRGQVPTEVADLVADVPGVAAAAGTRFGIAELIDPPGGPSRARARPRSAPPGSTTPASTSSRWPRLGASPGGSWSTWPPPGGPASASATTWPWPSPPAPSTSLSSASSASAPRTACPAHGHAVRSGDGGRASASPFRYGGHRRRGPFRPDRVGGPRSGGGRRQYGPGPLEAILGGSASQEQADAVKDYFSFVTRALAAFSAAALFVGGFLILNTFTITLTQRTRELALLRPSARRRQVFASQVAGPGSSDSSPGPSAHRRHRLAEGCAGCSGWPGRRCRRDRWSSRRRPGAHHPARRRRHRPRCALPMLAGDARRAGRRHHR